MTDAPPAPPLVKRRRARRTSTSDRHWQGRVVALAIVLGTIAGLAVSPRSPLRHTSSQLPAPAQPSIPGRTLLFAHVDAQHRTDLLQLIALQPGARESDVVFVPSPTVVEVPSLDLVPLADVTRFADRQLLATAIENALGVRIDDLLVVDDAGLSRLVAPVPTLSVTFTTDVRIDGPNGGIGWRAGTNRLTSAQAQQVLLGHETDGTLSHLVTVQAVMTAWFSALRSPALARRTVQLDSHSGVLVAAARTRASFDTLPVDPVAAGTNERFQIRDRDAAALVADDFAFARLALAGRRPRVELLNGVGAVSITPRAARLLVPAGANVLLTQNVPGFGVRATQVVYYRDGDAAAARTFAQVLGVGSVAKGDTPLDVVDITVVIGHDFVTRHPA